MVDLSHETPKPVKVSFAADPDHASPRCTNTDIFLGISKTSSPGSKYVAPSANREANTMSNPSKYSYEDASEETPAEVAMLLASVADIASKELKADPPIITALADVFPRFPDLSSTLSDEGEVMEYEAGQYPPVAAAPALMHFDHNNNGNNKKMRAVSMDFPELRAGQELLAHPPSPPHEDEAIPTLMQWRNLRGETTSPPHHPGIFSTPPPSPLASSMRHGRRAASSDYNRRSKHVLSVRHHGHGNRPRSVSLAEAAIEQVPILELHAPASSASDKPKTLILRRKFSWKNYPELEEFLIANREEYLRHSTLNYTMQQKKYNNCLTERMIKLAGEHGYIFDETEFSFVTVRDRIRCYYKSYVQSMKKRGVVIGYAARKAGLVTEEELEQSAHTSGKIYVPRN